MPAISNPICEDCGKFKRAGEFRKCSACRNSRWHSTEAASLDKVLKPADIMVPVPRDHVHSWISWMSNLSDGHEESVGAGVPDSSTVWATRIQTARSRLTSTSLQTQIDAWVRVLLSARL